MLARTHGQPASPRTAGKEAIVFTIKLAKSYVKNRFDLQRQRRVLMFVIFARPLNS